MYKKYRVELTAQQRQELRRLLTAGRVPPTTHTHARVLLQADTSPGAPAWTDAQISTALQISVRSVVRVRQAFVTRGFTAAVTRQARSGPPRRKVDGRLEAQLVAVVCGAPPAGQARWTLRLLADQLVELTDLDSIALETVRQTLKKTNLSPG
jgi:hypothetical protein